MPQSNSAEKPLALSIGEPAGVGPEIALKTWAGRDAAKVPVFFLLADPEHLRAEARHFGLDVPVREIAAPEEAVGLFDQALPVMPVPLAEPVRHGQPSAGNATAVIRAITVGVELCRAGKAGALVTNPINKAVLYGAGFQFPGHTEFLAHLCQVTVPVMMLASEELKVVLVSIHIALREAIATLSEEGIVATARAAHLALRRDFGIENPRLAVAGLNPHAGESGSMGREDEAIIAPAVRRLQADGIAASGPLPPDTMFHAAARTRYDAAICMYHDQGLIPLKTLDFDRGVNVTLGLPIIRTSPDHGTAFDIAGSGRAKPDSLIAALKMAGQMVRHRASFDARST